MRLLAAALRRHDDRDRAFAWVEEAAKLIMTVRSVGRDRRNDRREDDEGVGLGSHCQEDELT